MQLSEHFSLEELIASEVAARLGIDNTPPAEMALAKGAGNSMHLQGLAADILCPKLGPPLDVCRAIVAAGI
jgi:hypothetical protein